MIEIHRGMEASWEGGGGFHVGTLRLKRDKPVLSRIRRRRVYPEDPGKISESFKGNKKREDRPALVLSRPSVPGPAGD